MSSSIDLTLHSSEFAIFLRLLIAAFIGGVVGWNRFRAGKPAGIGTHALVALGSAIFVLVPISMISVLGRDGVTRVIQGVVAGIGFLGAGEIFRDPSTTTRVHGLTSAAALWVTAALGVLAACGSGMVILAASSLVLAILYIAPHLEHHLPPQAQDGQGPGVTGIGGRNSTGVQE
jgi:putative Mg2+ transporter-C (MgtC) family protein